MKRTTKAFMAHLRWLRPRARRGLGLVVIGCAFALSGCGPAPLGADAGAGDQGSDAGAADGGGGSQSLRIATFNMHLFFDTVCDSGACGSSDFEQVPSQAKFQARVKEVAAAIRALSVDAVALQEIETQRGFDAVIAALQAELPYAAFGETGGAGSLDVGVLSRVPILGIRRHRSRTLTRPDGSRTTFTREFLEVHLDLGSARAILFAAHFRSKWQDDPGRREAEGQAAGEILKESAQAFPDATVLMAGDLNDTPDSAPLKALESSSGALRVAAELGASADTFYYQGTGYAIDHVYLMPSAQAHYVEGSAQVKRDGSRGYGGSDHAALSASFVVGG